MAGSPDQIDVNVKVEEKPTGQFVARRGIFQRRQSWWFSTSIAQNNIFGSGNYVAASVSTGRTNKVIPVPSSPYFTVDGVSRAFDVYRVISTRLTSTLATTGRSTGGACVSVTPHVARHRWWSVSRAITLINLGALPADAPV